MNHNRETMGCGSSSAQDVVATPHMNSLPNAYPKQALMDPQNPHFKGPPMQVHQMPLQPTHELVIPNSVPGMHVPPNHVTGILTCPTAPPHHNGHQMTNDHHGNNNDNPVHISEEHLEQYVSLEKDIHSMEKQKVLQNLHRAVNVLQGITNEITKLETEKTKLEGKINSSETSGQELLKEIDSIDGNGKVIQKMKGAANNEQSVKQLIESQLTIKRKKYQECEKEVSELNIKAAELLDMYLKQDELIAHMFGQAHANEAEAKLGNQLCTLEERKERIEAARRKWKEAQLLLEYACKQLAVAVKQWQNLPDVPTINLEVRYTLSEENQQAMARQAQENHGLPGEDWSDMPVCTPEELAALEAMANGQSSDHGTKMYTCSEAHKQAVATLQWFNKVLNTTIHRDLVDVCEEVRVTSQSLRKERIHLVKSKLKEKYGKSFDLDTESISEEEEIKKMLSVCKDDKCKIEHSSHEAKTNVNLQRKPKIQIEEVKLPTTVKKIVTVNGAIADHTKTVEKLDGNLKQHKARVEKQLDEQLNTRRNIRAQKSPVRTEVEVTP